MVNVSADIRKSVLSLQMIQAILRHIGIRTNIPMPLVQHKEANSEMAHVSSLQIQHARDVNLLYYLGIRYPKAFQYLPELHVCKYDKRQIVPTQNGNASHLPEKIAMGNPIDFLMRYLEYDFVRAVKELNSFSQKNPPETRTDPKTSVTDAPCQADPGLETQASSWKLPTCADPPYRHLFGHMVYRGIPYPVVQRLVRQGFLYQEAKTNNAVFVNRERDLYESFGTLSYSRFPFYECRRSNTNAYWLIQNSQYTPKRVCICSNAIDAVSLLILQQKAGIETPCAYVSIGGSEYLSALDSVLHFAAANSVTPYLALTPEIQKDVLQKRHLKLFTLCPRSVSWSEDLMNGLDFTDPVLT